MHDWRSDLDRAVRSNALASPLGLPQHPDQNGSKHPILLRRGERVTIGSQSCRPVRCWVVRTLPVVTC